MPFRIYLQNADKQAGVSDSQFTDSRSLQNGAKEFLPPSPIFSTVLNTVLYMKSPRDACSSCRFRLYRYTEQNTLLLYPVWGPTGTTVQYCQFVHLQHCYMFRPKCTCIGRQSTYCYNNSVPALSSGLSFCKLWICFRFMVPSISDDNNE
jgi:hypothetical protein